jgi:hypothetical protein
LLHLQPSFSSGYEPEQPSVLVRLRVNGDDLGSVDVEALEDLRPPKRGALAVQ